MSSASAGPRVPRFAIGLPERFIGAEPASIAGLPRGVPRALIFFVELLFDGLSKGTSRFREPE